MIGFLASTINGARNHPEQAVVNRYCELASASMCDGHGWTDESIVVEDTSTLVPRTAVNSLTDKHQVLYPVVT
jgi:hypothetical protein